METLQPQTMATATTQAFQVREHLPDGDWLSLGELDSRASADICCELWSQLLPAGRFYVFQRDTKGDWTQA